MKPDIFPEMNVTFAKDQSEYLPLPAYRTEKGEVITRWSFSWKERLLVLIGRPMWFIQMTFNQPLQPQLPTMDRPFK